MILNCYLTLFLTFHIFFLQTLVRILFHVIQVFLYGESLIIYLFPFVRLIHTQDIFYGICKVVYPPIQRLLCDVRR